MHACGSGVSALEKLPVPLSKRNIYPKRSPAAVASECDSAQNKQPETLNFWRNAVTEVNQGGFPEAVTLDLAPVERGRETEHRCPRGLWSMQSRVLEAVGRPRLPLLYPSPSSRASDTRPTIQSSAWPPPHALSLGSFLGPNTGGSSHPVSLLSLSLHSWTGEG